MSLSASMLKFQCPECKKLPASRPKGQCVVCQECSRSRQRVYRYCWACRREWPSSCSPEDSCPRPDCAMRAAMISPKRINKPDSLVHGCPYFRACPACKALLNHTGTGCPNITCPKCRTSFCYRCLRQDCTGLFPETMIRAFIYRMSGINLCTIVDNPVN